MKKGIAYERKSTEKQSNFSILSQHTNIKAWFERTKTILVDTFIDDGYSATNFDRPDWAKLEAFVLKHHKTIDYLVINTFDRISRSAGEALVKIKGLHRKYGISVVSVTENIIYDANDASSAFSTGLRVLIAEDENIRHRYRVNQGIYTAKKQEGRYLNKAPLGYINGKDEASRKTLIKVHPENALIIKYMFDAYISGTPIYIIMETAKSMGWNQKGKSAVQDILANPLYTGLLKLKAFKDMPGGMVEANHEAIIDRRTWQQVQDKLTAKYKPLTLIDDAMPLRGVLKCHCELPLTGAPSKGRNGNYWYYYKCKMSGHNNISAEKAHAQLHDIFGFMSLRPAMLTGIKEMSHKMLDEQLKSGSQQAGNLRRKLEETTQQLHSVEEKFLLNQLPFESYQRWYNELTLKQSDMTLEIERLTKDTSQTWLLLNKELEKLQDVRYIYTSATTLQKQELVRLVFDSSLYYQKPSYRTTYIMPVFAHNTLIMKEKGLLILDEKAGNRGATRLGGE